MSESDVNFNQEMLHSQLQSLQQTVSALAQSAQGDSLALLKILRTLENSHREIAEGLFQEALPQNRQQLYHLLKDIESEGGWPYIPRARLRSLLTQMKQDIE